MQDGEQMHIFQTHNFQTVIYMLHILRIPCKMNLCAFGDWLG